MSWGQKGYFGGGKETTKGTKKREMGQKKLFGTQIRGESTYTKIASTPEPS